MQTTSLRGFRPMQTFLVVADRCAPQCLRLRRTRQPKQNAANRKVFPTDESALKILFLNIRNFTLGWTKRQELGYSYESVAHDLR